MGVVTLCFVKKNEQILMINRHKKPFMGLWNALGGHLENNETPLECALREIYEESHIKLDSATLISISTWNYDDDEIYVYLSELPDDFNLENYPIKISEGVIDFKDIDWIIDENNYGVVEDLRIFLKDIKEQTYHNYHLIYNQNKLLKAVKKNS